MKRILAAGLLFFLLNSNIALGQKRGVRFLINNLRVAVSPEYVFAGNKPGMYLVPGKVKEDVLLIDVDVLKIIASYKVLKVDTANPDLSNYKMIIEYRIWYRGTAEERQEKEHLYAVKNKTLFNEVEVLQVKEGKRKSTIRLTYTGTLSE